MALTRFVHVIAVWARDAVGKSWMKRNEKLNARRAGLRTIPRASRMGARGWLQARRPKPREPEAGSRQPDVMFAVTPSAHRHAAVRVPVDAIRRIATNRARDRSASSGAAIQRSPRTTCGTGTRTAESTARDRRNRNATDRSNRTGNTDTAAVEPPERRLEQPAHSRPAVAARCRATRRPDTRSRRLRSPRPPPAQQFPSASFETRYPSHPPRRGRALARRGRLQAARLCD